MNNSPSNIFSMLLLLERYHKNCQLFIFCFSRSKKRMEKALHQAKESITDLSERLLAAQQGTSPQNMSHLASDWMKL